jgi:protein-export membrane protein SecD
MRKILACLLLPFAISGCDRLQQPINVMAQNGPYIVLELESAPDREPILEALSEQMAAALRSSSIRYSGRGADDEAARIRLVDPTDLPRAREAIAAVTDQFEVSEKSDGLIEARPTLAFDEEIAEHAIIQSIEVLQRRLDPTEVIRARVERHGDSQILVRVADIETRNAAHAMIATMGELTFHLVREVDTVAVAAPRGFMVVQPFDQAGRAEVVKERPELTNVHIMRASPSMDPQTGAFVLSFQLNGEGTRLFCRITSDNTGSRFAVLFDNRVLTAPTINEPICGGSGQISGNFTAESANELAVLMNAGALPARLRIVEEGVGVPRR